MLKQDEIIDIYKEVSNKLCNGTEWCWAGVGEPLQLFAKLVDAKATAKEREACAKLCERDAAAWGYDSNGASCAIAIRARGTET